VSEAEEEVILACRKGCAVVWVYDPPRWVECPRCGSTDTYEPSSGPPMTKEEEEKLDESFREAGFL